MSWSSYWIAPWMFFGPMMTFLLMMICMVGMFFITRVGTMHHSSAEFGPIRLGFGFARGVAFRRSGSAAACRDSYARCHRNKARHEQYSAERQIAYPSTNLFGTLPSKKRLPRADQFQHEPE
jgi:hypothetical protein